LLTNQSVERRLHHAGYVVRKIHESIGRFLASLEAHWDENIIHDPLQKVNVTFLSTPNPKDALIELVEPAAMDSPILAFLKKGGGLHHLCYEVADLDARLKEMQVKGFIVVKKPLPAVAFENRRIAWIATRENLLLEFLEARKNMNGSFLDAHSVRVEE
jgi:methylmalonyl-CoA/ethylmalonyl-CoA epimerase